MPITLGKDIPRQIVPRWRPSNLTAQVGELNSVRNPQQLLDENPRLLDESIAAWKTHGTISFAADLVGAAFVLNRRDQEARDAAEMLLGPAGDHLSSMVKELARGILTQDVTIEVEPLALVERDKRRRSIRDFKRRLVVEPLNPFMWVDLALHYTALGQMTQAQRSIEVALALAPNDRFVLRSAARFFVHDGQPDLAQQVLRRSGRTVNDPWLLASEIACAAVAGRTSKLVRRGQELMAAGLPPHHVSELAVALGTLGMYNGEQKKRVRSLFQAALKDPNENVIAQAMWAGRNGSGVTPGEESWRTPLSFEANAWRYHEEGLWVDAEREAHQWCLDEPFAARPAVFGSFVSAVALNDYENSVWFARVGLQAQPHAGLLRNNLVFALASADRLVEAQQQYDLIQHDHLNAESYVPYEANAGLLAFRNGRAEEGRRRYQNAIALAEKLPAREALALALVFHAREEGRLSPTAAADLLKRAEPIIERTNPVMKKAIKEAYGRAKAIVEQSAQVNPTKS